VQIDSSREPLQGALVFFQLAEAHRKTVDKSIVIGILPESLPIVIHWSVHLSLPSAQETLLLPELRALHVFDMRIEFHSVPLELGHGQLLQGWLEWLIVEWLVQALENLIGDLG